MNARWTRLWHGTPVWRPWLHGGRWRLPARLAELDGAARVLLTFDDGPSSSTLAIARCLRELDARGLFFLLGERMAAAGSREIVQELAAAGHGLGVHGWEHRRQACRPPARVAADFLRAARLLEELGGGRARHLRPPYGSWAPWLRGVPSACGLEPLFWSFNPFDYHPRGAVPLAELAGSQLQAGDILLLHCTGRGAQDTLAALPGLLEGLRGRGLQPLDPLLLEARDG